MVLKLINRCAWLQLARNPQHCCPAWTIVTILSSCIFQLWILSHLSEFLSSIFMIMSFHVYALIKQCKIYIYVSAVWISWRHALVTRWKRWCELNPWVSASTSVFLTTEGGIQSTQPRLVRNGQCFYASGFLGENKVFNICAWEIEISNLCRIWMRQLEFVSVFHRALVF